MNQDLILKLVLCLAQIRRYNLTYHDTATVIYKLLVIEGYIQDCDKYTEWHDNGGLGKFYNEVVSLLPEKVVQP